MKKSSLALIIALIGVAIYTLFYGKETVMKFSKYMKGKTWNRMLPELQKRTTATIEQAQAEGLDVMFYEGWRSVTRSQEMIDKGTSKLKNAEDSDHVWSIGVDLVFANSLGLASWPDISDPRWKRLHEIGNANGLEFYISWDAPHARLSGYSVSALKKQYGHAQNFLESEGIYV